MQHTEDRTIINELFHQGFINQQARDNALEILCPQVGLKIWISQILTILGTIFILTGIIFYFAFNWEKLSDYYKFASIELGLVISLLGSLAFKDKLSGKLFLTAASILIGVFMAVFGQIYQTGADVSTLFITWFLLILPWVLLSQFAPLWFIWVILVNSAVILYWVQEVIVTRHTTFYIFSILILLNTCFLFLREFFSGSLFLQGRWSRILLVIGILCISIIPIVTLILLNPNWQDTSLVISAILGLLVQACFLYYYRCVSLDKWVYALTLLFICLILCTFSLKLLDELKLSQTLLWLFMTLLTLFIFSTAAFILRK